ncbi:hypothetical protein QA600_01275 [Natronococcus sp. A-GB1]|uniref:hypothetical protein n=1 Tax=Natronococcus sp. A-GB1 TaxID=3037648 RepID=UPI00241F183D|nr:hypothetical protein [Natronococcus sp. A-GB1]MDG5757970.1 hypothetical protein [Natronococcus sp. A-GB1]
MRPTIEELDLQHELVQLLAHEAVRAAMETPLQEPILEAVEGSVDESAPTADDALEGSEDEFEIDEGGEGGEDERPADEDDETEAETEADGKSAFAKATQGLLTFLVMFAVLYVLFRRLGGGD